ncbi:microtubule-actin cross-linking factor 1-like [Polypterus senegalus]|uniref:microtubule-actin cross-linking factor 1-like n=1 Tax=Polypterus senegalus TaxID=55291 RepID=UPI001966A438|nr:microtubule-actin cross-linking factor 1-like [Polypterus senegalus]
MEAVSVNSALQEATAEKKSKRILQKAKGGAETVSQEKRQKPMSGRRERVQVAVEESSSGSSSSPSPGDTLPWNLAKHQRTKRSKSASGNGTVLDPAERAVIRIAAQRRAQVLEVAYQTL